MKGQAWKAEEDALVISVRKRNRRDIDAIRELMPLLPHRTRLMYSDFVISRTR